MSHAEEQAAARERKRLRKEGLAKLQEQQKFYAERRARMLYIDIDIDDLRRMLLSEELIPEGTTEIEWLGKNGKEGIRVLAYKP